MKNEKLSPQSVLNVKWRWKQRCLQLPAKQLQWWRSPDRRRQVVPGACSRYREGAVAKCDASRWRHDQCRRRNRPKTLTCIYVGGLAEGLGKIRWCSTIKVQMCTPEHTTRSGSSPELATSAVHGEVGLCVPISSPRTPSVRRHSWQTVAAVTVCRKFQLTLSSSSQPCWPRQQGVTRQWSPHPADLSECCKAGSDCCSYVGSHGDVSVYVERRGRQHRCVMDADRNWKLKGETGDEQTNTRAPRSWQGWAAADLPSSMLTRHPCRQTDAHVALWYLHLVTEPIDLCVVCTGEWMKMVTTDQPQQVSCEDRTYCVQPVR